MTIHPEELLAHRGFVRAVAQKLVRDEDFAADLTQQTFLAVLENPPPPEAPVGGWLYRVARNLAIKLRLSEARRYKREQASARSERVPSTEEVVEQEEVRRRVVRAVLGLEEPYRSTVLLRYYEDLPPRKVAESQGVPVETVKTRLKRGVKILRDELDVRYGGSRKDWLTAILPVAGLTFADAANKSIFNLSCLFLRNLPASVKLAGGLSLVGCAILATTLTMVLGLSWAEKKDPQTDPASKVFSEPEKTEQDYREDGLSKNVEPDPTPHTSPSVTAVKHKRMEPASSVSSVETVRSTGDETKKKEFPVEPAQSDNENPYNMALIPAGKVKLGLSKDEAVDLSGGDKKLLDLYARSVPRHIVEVDAFFCDYYEVTNAQWETYLKKTGRQPSELLVRYCWKNQMTCPKGEELHPVRNISFVEARSFAGWCGKRLPSEAEYARSSRRGG